MHSGICYLMFRSFAFADLVTVMSLAILIFLFSLQRFGTARVSFLFAPIFTTWFLVLAMIGCYNIIKWDKTVFTAFNPLHIVYFFKRNGKLGWEHLGGIVLCMTGINIIPFFFFVSRWYLALHCIIITRSCILTRGGICVDSEKCVTRTEFRNVSETEFHDFSTYVNLYQS